MHVSVTSGGYSRTAPAQHDTRRSLAISQDRRSCRVWAKGYAATAGGRGGRKASTTLPTGSSRLPGTRAADSGDQPNYRSRVTGRATRHTEDATAGGSLRQACGLIGGAPLCFDSGAGWRRDAEMAVKQTGYSR